MKHLFLSYLSYQVNNLSLKTLIIPMLSPISNLGNLFVFILPITYLSYLFFTGRLVTFGNFKVGSKSPISRGFGNLGNIFCQKLFRIYFFVTAFTFLFLLFTSCSPMYILNQDEKKQLDKYPARIHQAIGIHPNKAKAYKVEKTDSIARSQQEDIYQDIREEQSQRQDFE